MAQRVNHRDIPAETAVAGIARQRLMSAASHAHASVGLDRYSLAPGARLDLEVGPDQLAWFQVLQGRLTLEQSGCKPPLDVAPLDDAHVCFLPPGFNGRLVAGEAVVLLVAVVPGALRLDPALAGGGAALRIIDWKREPVLNSEHDARKRIYLVTPGLFGTTAIKGEMIIYPPGTEAANHHHEGAEHFMYVLAGSGTAWANEVPMAVREGDLIWYADRERHYLKSDDAAEMRFVEFFVPGRYRTVWAPGAMVCTWSPTGRNIGGGEPAREIAHHRSDAAMPSDV